MSSPRKRRTGVMIFLACAALVGLALAHSPSTPEENTAEDGDDASRWEAAAPVQQAIAAARRYYTEAYAESPVRFEENIRVRDTATGAFTRAGVEQRAVLYQMSTQSRGFPNLGLAIVEGDRLVGNFAHSLLAETVETLRDLDGSGRDALAFEGGFGMGGQYTRGVTIATFGEDALVALGQATTYEDVCGMAREGSEGPTRARVSVVGGTGLLIARERKEACDSETWEPVGGPEPLLLDPPERNPFVDISQRTP